MRPTIAFVSLGCPKNLVDTERMMDLLSKDGAILSGNHETSDVVVINTCGFLEPARQESMGTIGEFITLKQKKKIKGVVVTGCMTERYLDQMSKAYPSVDAFLQTKDFSKITEVVNEIVEGDEEKLLARRTLLGDTPQLSGHSELTDYVKLSPGKRSFAYVKIAEGCNRTCSFCIIPKLRGKLHSRSIEGVVDEVKQLVKNGTQEVIFIAQDLTSYGRDRNDSASLLDLLKAIEEVDGLVWYRLMYNYPRFFTDELVKHLAQSKKFARYLDIPFQHISDRVLKQMRRPEGSEEIKKLVRSLRTEIPDIFLRTTLMVGFPGETDADFEALLEFVEESEFDHLGAFTFWREAGTPSFDLPNQVDETIKTERFKKLMSLQKKIQKKRLKVLVGSVQDFIVDGFSEKTKQGLVFRGRHQGQAPEIDGMTYAVSDEPLEIGQIYPVELHKIIGDYDLLATPVVETRVAEMLNTCRRSPPDFDR